MRHVDMSSSKLVVTVIAAALLALGMVACGADATATPTATPAAAAPAAWEVEWEETLAAAQAEGELTMILGAAASRLMAPVYEEFTRQFDIEVITAVGRGGAHVDRVFAERQAGKYTVDMGALGMFQVNERLVPADALEPIEPLLFLPDVIDQSNWFGGRFWWGDAPQKYAFLYSGTVGAPDGGLIWNTNVLGADFGESLETIWDVLDPSLKGMGIGLPPGQPQTSNSAVAFYQIEDIGPEFFERFFTETDFTFVEDPALAVDALLLGEKGYAMFLGGVRRDLVKLAAQDAPISGLDIEGRELGGSKELKSGSSLSHVMVFDRLPHPNAAKLYVNWFFSKEGQTFYHLNVEEPNVSLRLDDIPPGNTLEIERLVPGETYLMPAFDPELIAQRPEALAFVNGLYDQYKAAQ